MKQLAKLLRKLCKYLDDEYSLNSGGCIYSAYLIAKNLQKLSIDYDVIFWYDSFDELYHISVAINGKYDTNPGCCFMYKSKSNIGKKTVRELSSFVKEYEEIDYIWTRSNKKKVREEINLFFKSYSEAVANSTS